VAKETDNNVNPPFQMDHLDSENVTIIEEQTVKLIEEKRLGTSTKEINIEDITAIEKSSDDEGDIIILRRKRGNPMTIGPLDSDVAQAGTDLLEKLIGD